MASLDFLEAALQKRKDSGLLRNIPDAVHPAKLDFISNDYLGLAKRQIKDILADLPDLAHLPLGSTGSRLVSGQHRWVENLEEACAHFFEGEAALFFPTGYLANLALVSCLASRSDTILYDERIHASLKEATRLSMGQKFSFKHNDYENLEKKLARSSGNKFVVIESVYSMDGDLAPIPAISAVCEKFDAHLLVDEAHATATYGPQGKGLTIESKNLVVPLARVFTFGKALGAAGAVVVMDRKLKDFLINFARPFIYSTGPSPVQAFICHSQLRFFQQNSDLLVRLQKVIACWNQLDPVGGKIQFSTNVDSPIQYVRCADFNSTRSLSQWLNNKGFLQKAMLAPTVPAGAERIRICLHACHTPVELYALRQAVKDFQNIFQADACD